MSKTCPKCGESLPDDAHFCGNCGYDFFRKDTSPKTTNTSESGFNGKMLLAIIVIAVIIIIGAFIATGSNGDGQAEQTDDASVIDFTITEVNGYSSSSSSPVSYTLYTDAIFNKVPSDLENYNVKTIYKDENGTEIGFETEKLSNIYYDTDYSIGFGFYTTYKKPLADQVTVEIIKEGKLIDNVTQKIDQGKIKFLN